jgi:hypothetical protein
MASLRFLGLPLLLGAGIVGTLCFFNRQADLVTRSYSDLNKQLFDEDSSENDENALSRPIQPPPLERFVTMNYVDGTNKHQITIGFRDPTNATDRCFFYEISTPNYEKKGKRRISTNDVQQIEQIVDIIYSNYESIINTPTNKFGIKL